MLSCCRMLWSLSHFSFKFFGEKTIPCFWVRYIFPNENCSLSVALREWNRIELMIYANSRFTTTSWNSKSRQSIWERTSERIQYWRTRILRHSQSPFSRIKELKCPFYFHTMAHVSWNGGSFHFWQLAFSFITLNFIGNFSHLINLSQLTRKLTDPSRMLEWFTAYGKICGISDHMSSSFDIRTGRDEKRLVHEIDSAVGRRRPDQVGEQRCWKLPFYDEKNWAQFIDFERKYAIQHVGFSGESLSARCTMAPMAVGAFHSSLLFPWSLWSFPCSKLKIKDEQEILLRARLN